MVIILTTVFSQVVSPLLTLVVLGMELSVPLVPAPLTSLPLFMGLTHLVEDLFADELH